MDLLHEIGELLGSLGKGGGFEDLGTNVGLNATDFQMRQRRGDFVDLWRAVETDAELVFAFSSGDELVRLGIDIRIHADGDRGFHAERTGDFVDALEFSLALDIEGINALAERVGDFLAGLADTGKSAAVSAGAGFENAEQLAARDDVESRAEPGEDLEDGEVRIGLHRETDEVIKRRQRGVEAAVVFPNRIRRIDIGRRPEAVRDFIKFHSLAMQRAIDIRKQMHRAKMGSFFRPVNRSLASYWPRRTREPGKFTMKRQTIFSRFSISQVSGLILNGSS